MTKRYRQTILWPRDKDRQYYDQEIDRQYYDQEIKTRQYYNQEIKTDNTMTKR